MSLLYHSKGVVSEVRYRPLGSGKICEVKIETDGRVSGWLPIRATSSASYSSSDDVSVGDQVVAHYFDEGMNDGYINCFLPSEKTPQPTKAKKGIMVRNIGGIELTVDKRTLRVTNIDKLVIDASNFKLDEAGNLIITGEITDKLGNLTKHKHAVKDHSEAVPR